jgi:hypothetical protein
MRLMADLDACTAANFEDEEHSKTGREKIA